MGLIASELLGLSPHTTGSELRELTASSCLVLLPKDVQKMSLHIAITLGKERYFPIGLWDKKKTFWASRKKLLVLPKRKTAWLLLTFVLYCWLLSPSSLPLACRVAGAPLLRASKCCAWCSRWWGRREAEGHHLPLSTAAGYFHRWPDTSTTTWLDTVLSNA